MLDRANDHSPPVDAGKMRIFVNCGQRAEKIETFHKEHRVIIERLGVCVRPDPVRTALGQFGGDCVTSGSLVRMTPGVTTIAAADDQVPSKQAGNVGLDDPVRDARWRRGAQSAVDKFELLSAAVAWPIEKFLDDHSPRERVWVTPRSVILCVPQTWRQRIAKKEGDGDVV